MLRERAHEVIFEAETPAGRAFEIALMPASWRAFVRSCRERLLGTAGLWCRAAPRRVLFTELFSLEYLARLAERAHKQRQHSFRLELARSITIVGLALELRSRLARTSHEQLNADTAID